VPGRRPSVAHRARPATDARHPVLVTIRAREDVTWLRCKTAYRAVASEIARSSGAEFRVVHYSVQTNHVHLIVEADGKQALSRGMRGVAIRVALAVNRALGRRGALWAERYHARALATPRAVRSALVYVLANARKHLRTIAGLDPCSSAPWFDGYRTRRPPPAAAPPTASPRTWLLRVGWRRHGLLRVDEAPARVDSRKAVR
jgi:REP element-mobilizing transposase RayT